MSYGCSSRNFSSRSFGGYLQYPGASCGSSYPNSLVYTTNLQSPTNCQRGSSLYSGCQETFFEPTSYESSCVVSSPCRKSCYRPRLPTSYNPCHTSYYGPRLSMFCRPCPTTYCRSLGLRSSSCSSLSLGPRSCYSPGCGSNGLRSLNYGIRSFPILNYQSSFCNSTYFPSRNVHSSCYRPFYRSASY